MDHRALSFGRVTNSFPSLPSQLGSDVISFTNAFSPPQAYLIPPFGSLAFCMSLHFTDSLVITFVNHLPSPLDSEFTKGRNPVLFILEFLLPPAGNVSY